MLDEFFLPQLVELGLENLWFQQVEATALSARPPNKTRWAASSGRLISRLGNFHWLERPPDLTVLDLFLRAS